MMELIPSGKIYEGFAYAYLINYLPYNLTYKTPEGRGKPFLYISMILC
jgi:hypothetical protein